MIWTVSPGGVNSRKNGTASTAKPNPLVAWSSAATKLVAAIPAQAPRVIGYGVLWPSAGTRGSGRSSRSENEPGADRSTAISR